MTIQASGKVFRALNEEIKASPAAELTVTEITGQRYIGAGLSGKTLTLQGVPGNALGAYMNGAKIFVGGNAQDAVGDTMNDGEIVVAGSCGDALGYAMRGGRILIKGNVGYRCGIHMKEYQDKVPVIVMGGRAGSFLGEYQAGGRIVVLNLAGETPVGDFCATGMHGGRIYVRGGLGSAVLPSQVEARRAESADLELIRGDIEAFCSAFGGDAGAILQEEFTLLSPNSKNPYKQLYTVY
ncbi:MAG: glutamate synthase [Christensenellaceae bacterium]|jgi:glutamate synthase domain-containing protein 3|nr:glutamate synthase [Christensenellaceae bacterium]